jgi:hypothetical protein
MKTAFTIELTDVEVIVLGHLLRGKDVQAMDSDILSRVEEKVAAAHAEWREATKGFGSLPMITP